ncbi:MAG: hypothetical protein AVDCRST_MAG76-1098, partial [uncultured Acidimicrobiales bacterium]
ASRSHPRAPDHRLPGGPPRHRPLDPGGPPAPEDLVPRPLRRRDGDHRRLVHPAPDRHPPKPGLAGDQHPLVPVRRPSERTPNAPQRRPL